MIEKERAKYLISQVNPDLIEKFFKVIRKGQIYNRQTIEEVLNKNGYLTQSFSKYLNEISDNLYNFGFLEKEKVEGHYYLSETGIKMKKKLLKDRDLFFEIYHLLSYNIFDLKSEDKKLLPFKSYQILCNYIYESEQIDTAKIIANYVDTKIKNEFLVEGSFSEVCITRGMAWLKNIIPDLIDENRNVKLRNELKVSVILFGIDLYYRKNKIEYKDPLFLDLNSKKLLSKQFFCTLDCLDRGIIEIAKLFPHYITVKYSVTGTYIILLKNAEVEDID